MDTQKTIECEGVDNVIDETPEKGGGKIGEVETGYGV